MSAFLKECDYLSLLIFPPTVDIHSKNTHKAMCSSNNYFYQPATRFAHGQLV